MASKIISSKTPGVVHSLQLQLSRYTKTVSIPKSSFPVKHDPKAELNIQEETQFANTYLEQDPTRKPYVIHDGPPFANGQIHLGHAINKILKDIAARYAMITGHKVEFITGWDCHGLPIEMQVLKLLDGTTSPEQFRTKARSYAKSQIDLQLASFKRMGLLTDWNKRYTTDDSSYVANQLRAFSQLFEQKLIFKDLMPVNWSLANKTTLADADIEYRPHHLSKSAYILHEIINPPFYSDVDGLPLYSLIWTTTPWTLLENQAIAFNKQETYCIVRYWNSNFSEVKNILISLDSLAKIQSLLSRLGLSYEVKTYVPGRSLCGLKYKPLFNSISSEDQDSVTLLPFLEAEFVEAAKGTGLVHLAPNYGFDDFDLIRKNKLPVRKVLIDGSGRFCEEAGKELAGKFIFTDGNQEILSLLDQRQALLFTEYTQHSYPYETRTNQPAMIRTSSQIFIDTSRIIPRCLKALETSSFFPENRRPQMISTLTSNLKWCISRQRIWGTPIPVLYDVHDVQQEKMISHPLIVEHFSKMLYKKRSMDYWWTLDNTELIPQELLDQCKLPFKTENLVRGMDIFDVWSDSGLSWHTIADSLNDPKSQADLYLEGVDQIRGWFSASSIYSVALRGCSPSKRFYLHGFALDESGRKMSKSQGNVVDPIQLFEAYGVDPVRLWTAKSAADNRDVRVAPATFKSSINEAISKIRLTFRYLIGALVDHDAVDAKLDHTKLEIFDQYYLDKLYRLGSTIDEQYKSHRYDQVVSTINKFLTSDLSPVYFVTIKDTLYCDEPESARRKSCLTVMNFTYNILLRCLYPLTPHIVHEAGQYMRPLEPLNLWQDLGYKASWKNDVLNDQFETIIELRTALIKCLGTRFDKIRNYDAVLTISDKKLFKKLSKITNCNPNLMSELFKTASFSLAYEANEKMMRPVEENRVSGLLSLDDGPPLGFELCLKDSSKRPCPRCRRYVISDVDENRNVCDRCREALGKLEMLD